jgi:hypothetical protein
MALLWICFLEFKLLFFGIDQIAEFLDKVCKSVKAVRFHYLLTHRHHPISFFGSHYSCTRIPAYCVHSFRVLIGRSWEWFWLGRGDDFNVAVFVHRLPVFVGRRSGEFDGFVAEWTDWETSTDYHDAHTKNQKRNLSVR